MDEKVFAIWFSEAMGYGNAFTKALFEKYGSFEEIYKLSEKGYSEAGISTGSAVYSRLCKKDLSMAERIYHFCCYNHFEILQCDSLLYPRKLWQIADPPALIYARGRMTSFDDNACLAVVGTRSYTDAGWNATYKITSGIADSGMIIITGLASGIDTAATRAALDSVGYAVGVLGTGVERIYPSENKELFEEMYTKGLVISERAPFSEITGRYFPIRNRLISGLSDGVLVGEGAVESGALITAAHASKQGRHVFAIPGDISGHESSGVNKLIRDGATPVFDAADVISEFSYIYAHKLKNDVINPACVGVPEQRSKKRIRVIRGENFSNVESQKNADCRADDTEKKLSNSTVKSENVSKRKGKIKTDALEFDKVFESNSNKHDAAAEPDTSSLNELEKKVYEHICQSEFKMTDDIHAELGENSIEVNIAITTLEIAGFIETEGPKIFKAKTNR